MREYLHKRRELINATKGRIGDEELEGALRELQLNYARLLSLRQRKIKYNLNLRVQTLHQRLEDIFELLALWQQYVEIIYMPDWEMDWLKSTMEIEARDDSMSYANKMKEHDIQKRLNLLFGPDQALP